MSAVIPQEQCRGKGKRSERAKNQTIKNISNRFVPGIVRPPVSSSCADARESIPKPEVKASNSLVSGSEPGSRCMEPTHAASDSSSMQDQDWQVEIGEILALFMELQTLGDRNLQKLAFSHIIHTITHMNQKHKDEARNRSLQNILFHMLQEEDEAKAKRALVTLCDLHRPKVWFDDRTTNAICSACFHTSPKIMIAALSFLLNYENIEDDDSDDSSSEDESTPQHQIVLNKEAVYKVTC
ncbi:hypothetical protein POM88_020737 [Heracleum sosnowskyi]|uniref:Protein SDA1 n=1 Tax=Heracleum sosnowskyi TaxID=360622 RepID=A0AAD8IBY4_9APIA|nr:hypothetical protein POM88_020737 [Heracleum sosnowskyi]